MEGKCDGEGEGEVVLMSKSVEVQHKRFYFELKESSAGQFLQISLNTYAGRRALVFPSSTISTFLDTFNSCLPSDQHQHDVFTKDLHIQNKVFYFHVGVNQWGRFLKALLLLRCSTSTQRFMNFSPRQVSEASVDGNRGSIFIPAGNRQNEDLKAFGRALAEIDRTSRLLFPPKQSLVGLPDVSAGFISDHSGQSSSTSQLNVVAFPDKISAGVSKVMRAGPRRFFFELKKTENRFLSISEVMGANRSSIFVPVSELKQFHEMVGHFLKINNDSTEALCIGESSELDSVEKPGGSGEVE